MTKQEISKILAIISVEYPNVLNDNLDLRIGLWHGELERYDYVLIEQAVKKILRTAKYEPKLADIFTAITEICRAAHETPESQWHNTETALYTAMRINTYEQWQRSYKSLSRAIKDFYVNYDGFVELRNLSDKEIRIERSRFFKRYDELIKNYEILDEIPQAALLAITESEKKLQLSDGRK